MAYYYHLAFELTPGPTLDISNFVPSSDLDIFNSNLPCHKTCTWTSYLAPRRGHRRSRTGAPDERQRRTSRPRSLTPPRRGSPKDVRARDQGREEKQRKALPVIEPSREYNSSCVEDYRFDQLLVESFNMETQAITALERQHIAEATRASLENSMQSLKGRYIPSDPKTTEIGWGVVHLYREPVKSAELENVDAAHGTGSTEVSEGYTDNDGTTLCILAVPSYMTPSDLLGWLGEETRGLVSHFRLVRTGRSNRYMVLLKFRESQAARRWQKQWNGKLFSSMEPENCHIVFVKSIRFESPSTKKDPASFPDMTNDPFTPAKMQSATAEDDVSTDDTSATLTSKPAPPPTPALIELPTCPVCLERMDETTGLATIFCQHVFHCACLQKWQGSGCPVCRYTQVDPINGFRRDHERAEEDECRVCGATDSLWICLVCGHVGCGRYDEAHAHAHFEQTSHTFAMDIKTQAIWDYANDEWVHRLIANKLDGKLVELPAAAAKGANSTTEVMLTKDKLEDVSMEYTSLLKGQLDSQRSYYEEQVDRAVDKASKAAIASDQATAQSLKATERLEAMEASHQMLLNETLPGLEREKIRAEQRAAKFESMARKMEKEWKEKEVISDSLMIRIGHLEKQVHELTDKNNDLEEQNRDLSFFISGTQRLKDQGEDVQEGTLQVAEPASKGKKKKGKDRT